MKAALIPPIPHLTQFGTGTFHLLLSHLVEDGRYFHHYQAQRGHGAYLVLDNSAHENREGETPAKLLKQAAALCAQEVVVPDCLEDGPRTVELAVTTLEAWFERPRASSLIERLNPALMYVPQGKDSLEWAQCLRELVLLHGFMSKRANIRKDFVIGLSKDYEVWPGGLLGLLDDHLWPLVQALSKKSVKVNVHLLGWGRDLAALRKISKAHPWIRSTDSAKPFVYAMNGIGLDYMLEEIPPYPGRPSDYFTRQMTMGQANLAGDNIRVFVKAAKAVNL